MGHNSSDASRPRTSSNLTQNSNRAILTRQNYHYQWNFRSEPGARIAFATRLTGRTSIANSPRPMAVSETPVTLTDTIRKVNHHLIRSCAMLAHEAPEEALQEADFALYLAEARHVFHLQSKSQLYRGLCLMELERWEDASAAFTRAASVRGWGTRAAELKDDAEIMILEVERRRMEQGRQ